MVSGSERRRQPEGSRARATNASVATARSGEHVDRHPIIELQGSAGNRAVVQLLAGRHEPHGSAGIGTVRPSIAVQRRPSARDRRRRARATKLKAADARALLQATVPVALASMSADQVGQVQRVLDAAVVNPEVSKEVADLDRKSIIAQSGAYANRDERMVRRADKAREDFVPVAESDKKVRLDFKKLLSEDALKPRTDNADEGAYLERVRNTLRSRGVWLRISPKRVRDPEDPSRLMIDPRSFEAWLSLGPNGDAIPSKTGELTRDSLLGTTMLGAGYYEQVHQGPAQAALDREIKRLLGALEMGVAGHNAQARIRREAFVGVAETADLLGGASFPDISMWDAPHKLVVRALELNTSGNLKGSQVFLINAAILTRNAARLLSEYIDDTSSGAERAVTVLKVLKTAGQVAGVALGVAGVAGVVRGGVAVARGAAGRTAVASDLDVAATQLTKSYTAEAGIYAEELSAVRAMWVPKGSVAGGVKPGTSSGAGSGFHRW